MMNLRVALRVMAVGAGAAGVLFASAVVLLAPARAHAEKVEQPELVWEKAFDKGIYAVGVDDDCFARTKGDITSCLKWIILLGQVWFFDGRGGLLPEPVKGYSGTDCVSANSRCVLTGQSAEENHAEGEFAHYTMLNWNGETVWEGDQIRGSALVRNDGSAVIGVSGGEDIQTWLEKLVFLDARGSVADTEVFAGSPSIPNLYCTGISQEYFAVVRAPREQWHEVRVYDRHGDLVWRQNAVRIGESFPYSIAVSDRGEVALAFVRLGGSDLGGTEVTVLIFDQDGILRDSLPLPKGGFSVITKVDDRLAFVSTENQGAGSYFLCYDLDRMKVRSLVADKDGGFPGNIAVNQKTGLVAVAVHPENGGDAIKIYDLDGNYRTKVAVEHPEDTYYFWFKLLDGGLLTAEKNKLRLYGIEGGK
jgi:hypothetical protein